MSGNMVYAAASLAARSERMRLMLYPGELLRLTGARPRVRVVSGTGWITCRSADHVLRTGDSLVLPRAAGTILLSALKGGALVVELTD